MNTEENVFKSEFNNVLIPLCMSKSNFNDMNDLLHDSDKEKTVKELTQININWLVDKTYEIIGIENLRKIIELIKNSNIDYAPRSALLELTAYNFILKTETTYDESFLNRTCIRKIKTYNMLVSLNQYEYDIFATVLMKNSKKYENRYESLISIIRKVTSGNEPADVNEIADIVDFMYEYDYERTSSAYADIRLYSNIEAPDNIMFTLVREYIKEFIESKSNRYINNEEILSYSNPDNPKLDDDACDELSQIVYELFKNNHYPNLTDKQIIKLMMPDLVEKISKLIHSDNNMAYWFAKTMIKIHQEYECNADMNYNDITDIKNLIESIQ